MNEISKKNLLERYGGSVPRYTSYPTAPHFHDAVTDGQYREWLEQIDPAHSGSLYLHVPFCRSMCWYCGCHTKIVNRAEPISDYAASVLAEIRLTAEAAGRRLAIEHIHFGGGTPTILQPESFNRIMDAVGREFAVAENSEIAVEADPRTFSPETIHALAQNGVNRVSLGIQDFNEHVQIAINRLQPRAMVAEIVESLHAAGIQAINMDLMYGLPEQSVGDIERTVEIAAAMKPDRVSLFGYAHVPWMKTHQRMIEEAALPGSAERMVQAEAASACLVAHGYERIGMDHFALPHDTMSQVHKEGALSRNFQGYTTDGADFLLGFGASAIGSLPGGYVQNSTSIPAYRRLVENGQLATARGVALSTEDRLRREVIVRLMCDFHVDLGEYGGFAAERAKLDRMQADGLVRLENDKISVTESGRPFVRSVCAVFDTYLQTGRARHSQAI